MAASPPALLHLQAEVGSEVTAEQSYEQSYEGDDNVHDSSSNLGGDSIRLGRVVDSRPSVLCDVSSGRNEQQRLSHADWQAAATQGEMVLAQAEETPEICEAASAPIINSHGFTWNAEQLAAIKLIAAGESCCIVGSAGTGKTTLNKESIRQLQQQPRIGVFTSSDATDVLLAGTACMVVCSFTNSAVANIAKHIENAANCCTIHKLIEFKPVFYEEWSDEKQAMVNKRVFEPARNKHNPLPSSLRTIIIEESGVVNIRLFNQLLDALPNPANVQFIFLGDLFQLDPPYDPAILGYALDCIPVVELVQVYRQALESPVLKFAIDIKEGKTWGGQHLAALCVDSGTHGKLTVKPWKHKIDSFKATIEAAKFIKKEWLAGNYNPDNSSIIIPFGAAANSKEKKDVFGSLNLNLLIADFLGASRQALVYEIIAGYSKHYYAVGDSIIYRKIRGKITEINHNGDYLGKLTPQMASKHLNRFGHVTHHGAASMEDELASSENAMNDIDRLLAAALADHKEATRNASHVLTLELDDGRIIVCSSSGEFDSQVLDFSYAQTCYKAQGGEWDNVYVFTHKSHAVGLSNEFFYTAVTRAKKQLTLICEPDHLLTACSRQAIPGRNWREKLSYFQQQKKRDSLIPFTRLLSWLGGNKAKLESQS